MEHNIVRSDLAKYEHERLLFIITQIQIIGKSLCIDVLHFSHHRVSRMNITHALKWVWNEP